MFLTIDEIQKSTGCKRENIEKHWPAIVAALKFSKIDTREVEIAAVATIATEVPDFAPVTEMGKREYFNRYDGRMGNTEPGDGFKYRGRGFIQITGKNNYRTYSRYLGIDIENNPDKALEPEIAALILAAYFHLRNVARAAQKKDWRRVRVYVNGGTNGWERFSQVINRLGEPCASSEKS